MGTRLLIGIVVFVAAISRLSSASAQEQNQELIQLRQQLAVHYLEPAPHMALAKFLWAHGDRLQAFYLLENARRNRFPQPEFDRAFAQTFGTPSTRDGAGLPVFNGAIKLQEMGNIKEAEQEFVRAAELSLRSVHIQSWVARFLYKVSHNDERALHYYLNAYFLDPHAYESEFVESRIRTINYEAADVRYRWLAQTGVSVTTILQDTNPTVVVLALQDVANHWSATHLGAVLKCMEHDDEVVRWLATTAISKNVDRSFDPTLRMLLRDDDLRKRGLAAYIAARLWKEESFPFLRQMLGEPAQLLRFDALSALAMEGGAEGRRIVREHRRHESHPELLRLIEKTSPR